MIFYFKTSLFRIVLSLMLLSHLAIYSIESYNLSKRYDTLWQDSSPSASYLEKRVQSGDKVLSESGAPIILSLYEENFPANTTTFDYFTYSNLSGDKAYEAGVRDAYFNWIELIGEKNPKSATLKKLHIIVKNNLNDSYKLVYSTEDHSVYKRTF